MSGPVEEQLRQAIVAIRSLKREVESLRAERTPPIAVVGLGCRLPGGANDPASLWQMLLAGRDAIVEVPPERWDNAAWYDPDPDAAGRMNSRHGGFLADIDRFDAGFFELSAREAAAMDPQQRLLLEVAWEALEDAAIAPDALAGSATGVFVGINNSDYYQMAMGDVRAIDAHAISGGVASVAAGRLSFLLGLNGPAVAIDTACSSSLAAVHLAVQSLRSAESRVALAGGVYAVLQPQLSVGLAKLRMLAPDGRCKTFDAAADGFVQGEGCALVVLKRLADALADGDRIHAVVRGSAMNQDGRSSSLTAPSRTAQVAVIRAALADAGLAPERIGYVEAHGTGTQLGDPIEVHALADALGRHRASPVALGAIKTNIGHLGPAAGIAGFVKAVLAVREGVVPPNLHLASLNPEVATEGAAFVFPRAPTPWPALDGRRAAGVSSFGFSGTNVHIVLEEAPEALPAVASDGPGVVIVCTSARSEAALEEARRRLVAALDDGADLAAVSRACTLGRRAFEHRIAVAAANPAEARARLAAAPAVRAAARPRLGLRFADPRQASDPARCAREVRALVDRLDEAGLAPALCTGEGWGEVLAAAAAGVLAWTEVIDAIARGADAIAALEPSGTARAVLVDGRSGAARPALTREDLRALARAPVATGAPDLDAALRALGCTVLACIAAAPGMPGREESRDGPMQVTIAVPADDAAFLRALAILHAHGFAPDWKRLLGTGPRAALPHYPFQRRRHWREAPASTLDRAPVTATAWPPGERVASPARDAQFRLDLGVARLPWLGDHRVHGRAVVPGAFQIACLAGAWAAVHRDAPCAIEALAFPRPLVAPESGSIDLWTVVSPEGEAQLATRSGEGFAVHATARVSTLAASAAAPLDLAALRERVRTPVSPTQWREQLATLGIAIGPAFTGIRSLHVAADEALAEVVLPAGLVAPAGAWHPALLDACLQVAGGALPSQARDGEALLPVGIEQVALHAAPAQALWVYARCTQRGEGYTAALAIADPDGRVLATVTGLHVRRASAGRLADAVAPALFHALQWLPSPGSTTAAQDPGIRLVLAARHATGADLAGRLAGRVLVVTDGSALQELGAKHWQAPAARLDELVARLGGVREVIDLRAWERTVPEPGTAACTEWLATVRALARATPAPRYALVTRGAVRATPHPGQAALWGLAATAALEHPELACRRIDAESLADVATELARADDGEPAVCWEAGVRRVARLVAQPPPPEATPRLRDTVLVTGGLGGLGRVVARWAVARGARALVLASRHAAGPEAETYARSLGVPVRLAAVDVSQRAAVEALVADLGALPPLRTILHAAGAQHPGLLATLDEAGLREPLAAKLDGAWWLHLATRTASLDHFVLFSSIASVLGAAGQGGYAAANAGLDALARHRRAQGLPALSIAWGRWAGDGMAATLDEAARSRVDALGILPMAPDTALAALDAALAADLVDPVVAAVDWARYRARCPAPHTLALVPGAAASQTAAPAPTREALAALAPAERRAALLDLLAARFAAVLGGHAPDPARPLVQLGLDSLLAMEVRAALQRELGVAAPLADLLGGASLAEIAGTLERELAQAPAPSATAQPAWEEFRL